MKIYLAGRFSNQRNLRVIRDYIERMPGDRHHVTSGWLDEASDSPIMAATRDLIDIDRADMLILWPDLSTTPGKPGAGMYVEFGYALAKGKLVYIVAPETSTCVFLHHPRVIRVATWNDMYVILTELP